MARDYARIMTAIWNHPGFCALREPEQRLFLLLCTQEDISAAGVLSLRVRRWAGMSSSSTPDGLAEVLKRLEAGRFIAVDWDVEEVLIRSFIRWDGGYNNPKRRPVIIRAADEVRSRVITELVAAEFTRCGIKRPPSTPPDRPPGGLSDSQVDSLSGTPDTGPVDSQADSLSSTPESGTTMLPPDSPFPQVNSLSDRQSTNRGVVGTYVTTEGTATHNPQPRRKTTLGAVRRKSPATPLPPDWTPNENCRAYAAEQGLDLDHEAEQFRLHAEAKDRRQVRWDAAFRMWLGTATALRTTRGRLRVVPDRFDPDDVLGPDMWDPPGAPLDIDTGPRAARDRWYRERIAEHRAEREAKARAVLASRQQPGTA